jgi:hypothetical protein
MKKYINENLIFSEYDNVFCDSLEAISWAHKHGLSKDAVIYTSSPAILHSDLSNINHIEAGWSKLKLRKFNKEMLKFSEDVFTAIKGLNGVTRGEALLVATESLRFHSFLYKAICLKKDDFYKKLLFIKVDTKLGGYKKDLNSPWDLLLSGNSNFKIHTYIPSKYKFEKMSVKGVSFIDRLKLAGLESIIYRLSLNISKFIPKNLIKKTVLVNKENELAIETIAQLIIKGYVVRKINITDFEGKKLEDFDFSKYRKVLTGLVLKRIEGWVCAEVEKTCVNYWLSIVESKLKYILLNRESYRDVLPFNNKNIIVFSGSLSNANGLALYDVCNERKIPIVTALHGVTHEISSLVKVRSCRFDSSASDLCLTHTDISSKVHNTTFFSHAQSIAVGLPSRLLRMSSCNKENNSINSSLLYVSTCLYRGNYSAHFVEFENDYLSFQRELGLVSNVFSKMTYTVSYKGYPEENPRYIDEDPLINYVKSVNNIKYIEDKVDVRYLLSEYNIVVTSGATSTIGWLVMTGKPVVFINWKSHMPLTTDAKKYFKDGLFLFDGDRKNFYNDLRLFLETPRNKIQKMWDKKSCSRDVMVKKYFTKYTDKPGERSANIVFNFIKNYHK